eukprot:gene10833-10990_t
MATLQPTPVARSVTPRTFGADGLEVSSVEGALIPVRAVSGVVGMQEAPTGECQEQQPNVIPMAFLADY